MSEGGRLNYDISEVTNIFKNKGFLLTEDIGKAFDSVNPLLIFPCVRETWIWEKIYKMDEHSFNKSRILYN